MPSASFLTTAPRDVEMTMSRKDKDHVTGNGVYTTWVNPLHEEVAYLTLDFGRYPDGVGGTPGGVHRSCPCGLVLRCVNARVGEDGGTSRTPRIAHDVHHTAQTIPRTPRTPRIQGPPPLPIIGPDFTTHGPLLLPSIGSYFTISCTSVD